MKTPKSLVHIEAQLAEIEPGSLRYDVLTCAKNFKISWLELGQHLVSIHRDKIYKEWGYLTFEAYCLKEIGIRRESAQKLLRSYFFLEKEEPEYVRKEFLEQAEVRRLPSCESVDTLRQVKNNDKFSEEDYLNLRQQVLEEGKADKEVKDVFRQMVKQQQEQDPQEERQKRRKQYVRRMLGTLATLKRELEINKFLPEPVLKELEKVIDSIETQID